MVELPPDLVAALRQGWVPRSEIVEAIKAQGFADRPTVMGHVRKPAREQAAPCVVVRRHDPASGVPQLRIRAAEDGERAGALGRVDEGHRSRARRFFRL